MELGKAHSQSTWWPVSEGDTIQAAWALKVCDDCVLEDTTSLMGEGQQIALAQTKRKGRALICVTNALVSASHTLMVSAVTIVRLAPHCRHTRLETPKPLTRTMLTYLKTTYVKIIKRILIKVVKTYDKVILYDQWILGLERGWDTKQNTVPSIKEQGRHKQVSMETFKTRMFPLLLLHNPSQ